MPTDTVEQSRHRLSRLSRPMGPVSSKASLLRDYLSLCAQFQGEIRREAAHAFVKNAHTIKDLRRLHGDRPKCLRRKQESPHIKSLGIPIPALHPASCCLMFKGMQKLLRTRRRCPFAEFLHMLLDKTGRLTCFDSQSPSPLNRGLASHCDSPPIWAQFSPQALALGPSICSIGRSQRIER